MTQLTSDTISSISGTSVSSLGLAAYPDQDPTCVQRAFESGINYFFFYSPGSKLFIAALKPLIEEHRDEIILAGGSGSRTPSGLRAVRRKIAKVAGADVLDIFFAEYIHPGDNTASVFGSGGVFDELRKWKAGGLIRYVGASCHDRSVAKRLAEDPRVEILIVSTWLIARLATKCFHRQLGRRLQWWHSRRHDGELYWKTAQTGLASRRPQRIATGIAWHIQRFALSSPLQNPSRNSNKMYVS